MISTDNSDPPDTVPRLPPRPPSQRRSKETMQLKIDELEKTVARLMKHLKLAPSNNGEVKVDHPVHSETTSISINDEVPEKMHRNPHWKKLRQAVTTANKFRSSSSTNKLKGRKNRTKRLSTVMKSRRNSEVEQHTTVVKAAEEMKVVSPPPPPKSLLLSVQKKRESLSSNP
jgi:hypothetical protein